MINEITQSGGGIGGIANRFNTESLESVSRPPEVAEANSAALQSDRAFFSPTIKIDTQSQTAIFIFRDEETGETIRQFPTEETIEAYKNGTETVTLAEETIGEQIGLSEAETESTNQTGAAAQQSSQEAFSPDSNINNTIPTGAISV